MKQHNQQINANETQEKVIDLVYPKDEQGKVQEKKVLRGQGQSITNNNTDASQAFNWTSSTSIPCKSPLIHPSNMTYPFPDPLVTETIEGIFNLVQQYGILTIE